MLCLEIRAPDRVNRTESDGRRPTGINTAKLFRGNLIRATFLEIRAAQPDLRPSRQQREKRPFLRVCELQSDGTEHSLERRQPLVDMSAEQKLFGGAAPQLERFCDARRAFGGSQVNSRGVSSAPRVN